MGIGNRKKNFFFEKFPFLAVSPTENWRKSRNSWFLVVFRLNLEKYWRYLKWVKTKKRKNYRNFITWALDEFSIININWVLNFQSTRKSHFFGQNCVPTKITAKLTKLHVFTKKQSCRAIKMLRYELLYDPVQSVGELRFF